MKKILGIIAFLMLLAVSQVSAQVPTCNNENGLNAKIGAIVNQGFTEINREWFQIAYLVAPTPPFLLGTLEVTFVGPYCGPACTPAFRVERYDARVNNYQGSCVWELSGN